MWAFHANGTGRRAERSTPATLCGITWTIQFSNARRPCSYASDPTAVRQYLNKLMMRASPVSRRTPNSALHLRPAMGPHYHRTRLGPFHYSFRLRVKAGALSKGGPQYFSDLCVLIRQSTLDKVVLRSYQLILVWRHPDVCDFGLPVTGL